MSWPSYGKLKLGNFKEKPESATLRTDFETGPAKESQVRSRVMNTRQVSYVFTLEEYGTWKTWFAANASGGKFFDWIDPIDGGTKSVRIIKSEYEAQFLNAEDGAEPNVEVGMQFEGWGL